MISCPRIVMAGTNSGTGKTSLSIALVAALKKRGLRVQAFKVGPDFLDPTLLSAVSGRECFNLDAWMMGKDYALDLFARKTADADIAVVEGVMGMFDGAEPKSSHGSTAEMAQWLESPVLLVVDASGMSRSIAATVKGFSGFEPGVNIHGVIANRVGSERHAKMLSEALQSCSLPPLVGAIPKGAFPPLASRHLGLVNARAQNLSPEVLAQFAAAVEENADVDAIIQMARKAPRIAGGGLPAGTPAKKRVAVGIAFDDAFSFYYRDTLSALEAAGCDLVRFSPIADGKLPEGLSALYFGGGYPEEHARELCENRGMLEDVRRFASTDRPIYAECGGLMYLSDGVELRDGGKFPLAGILPSWVKMNEKFRALGYAEVVLKKDTLVGGAGARLRGHRFHYSGLARDPVRGGWDTAYSLTGRNGGPASDEGYQRGNVLASYVHLHMASRPDSINNFIACCARGL